MRYAFYPGCSLESSAYDYDWSIRAVCPELGIELEEIPDWNCCGTTAIPSVDPAAAAVLGARNLALAEATGAADVAVACSSCYAMLTRALNFYREDPAMNALISQALAAGGRTLSGSGQVKHLLEIIVRDVGLDAVKALVRKPLSGLKVVPYYGCMIVRPKGTFDDTEQPMALDHLLEALGAQVVPFERKTKCCGGALMTTKEKAALRLNEDLLYEASSKEADVIAVACPMCQMNLDAYQTKVNAAYGTRYRMPVMYFTQLMGLAFGLDRRRLAVGKGTVSHAGVLRAVGLA